MYSFLTAIAVGFITAAIPGPVFLFFLSKTLKAGSKAGIAIALGATVVDFIYSAVAALGVSVILEIFVVNKDYIRILGGILLIYLAYYELRIDIQPDVLYLKERKNFKLFLKILLINLSNPLTIGSFMGIFVGVIDKVSTVSEAFIIGLGVFIGSNIWFLLLGLLIIRIRKKIPIAWLTRIKFIAAGIIGLLGLSIIFGF